MKKQKSSLLQRMMAVQLCIVLVAGMVLTAAPVTVLAQEPTEGQENVSGNDVGAERGKEPESTDDPEGLEKPESMVIEGGVTQDADIASGTDWVLDGSGKLTISSDAGMADWYEKKADINTWYEPRVTSVEIKNGVTSIVADAFSGCRYMTSITIPEGVASIGSAAFSTCEGLTSIVLPESLTSIGTDAFQFCKGLTSIAIPEGVTTLETNTFNYCESLTSVTIPESMIYIYHGVFYHCYELTSITIPENVIYIGQDAFGECSKLTEITIPESVVSIGREAFADCSMLTKVTMLGETPPRIGVEVFKGCGFVQNDIKGIHVPQGKIQTYQDAWTDWAYYIAGSHTHNLTLTPAKPADCTKDGNQEYYTCDGCGEWFSDAAGMQKVTDKDSVVINKLGHDWGEWVVKKPAAETTPGQKERTCNRCGQKETETIPATGSGTIITEVKREENAPAISISTPTKEVEDMLLTEPERQQAQNGTDIRIILEVQDAGNTVSDSDKTAVERALNDMTVGGYLNIQLYKLVGEKRTDITETAEKIKIVIATPDSLKNTDGNMTRTFAVIRVHGGRAEILPDLDNNADTITIETDRFSTYAIVYKDTPSGGNDNNNNGGNDDSGNNNSSDHGGNDDSDNNNSNNNGGNNNSNHNGDGDNNSNDNHSGKNDAKPDSSKDGEPRTGEVAPLELYATVAMIAGFAYLLLYFSDREKGMTEETKKELVSRIVRWAKRGGRTRKCLALALIFVLLVYYHSIGKKACSEWQYI